MLVNFRFKNFKSFYEENNLSMQATCDKELEELNTFLVSENLLGKNQNELLKSAIIFGGNASGKSNVIKGLTYMLNAIRLSGADQFDVIERNDNFLFYEEASNENSLYEVEIIQNGAYYKYGFTILNGKVEKEWLFRKKERSTLVFNRNGNQLKIVGLNQKATSLIKIPANTLFLSVGNNFNLQISKYLEDVLNWFRSLLVVFENAANSFDIYTAENEKYKKQAMDILAKADIGIKDFKVIKDKIANIKNLNEMLNYSTQYQINPQKYAGQMKQEQELLYNIDLQTKFNVYNKDNKIVGEKNIMLFKDSGFNSEGTIRLLCYLGFILAALDKGRIILIDEIDSKLHFLVADYLIKLFNSINNNINNAQLICTAHNVMLMDEDVRRDQIYFTSKDDVGVSSLVSLADYKAVRKTDLFSKRYLSGFYSKLPNMNKKV